MLTGSQQFELMRGVTQSLAGRTVVLCLLPFTAAEVVQLSPAARQQSLPQWLCTGFFPAFMTGSLTHRRRWRLILRPMWSVICGSWRLCAGRVGQLLNLTSLGNDAGVSQSTAQAWLDLLQTSCIVYLLPPWFTNSSKRLIKSPKLHFYDVGLASWLLGLRSPEQVARDPLWGSLFVNFVVMEALKDKANQGDSTPLYFYRDATGNEVDLLVPTGSQYRAIEIKAGSTVNPDYFRGLRQFANAHGLHLEGGGVLYGGSHNQSRSDWPVWSWRTLLERPV
ncbi:MAG: hypothetical protein RLZZ401_1519 [Pseudomonadota bacterium]